MTYTQISVTNWKLMHQQNLYLIVFSTKNNTYVPVKHLGETNEIYKFLELTVLQNFVGEKI